MLSAIESTVSLIMRTCSAGDDDDGVRRFFSMPSRELRCCFSWALQRFASSSTSAGGWSAALKDGRPTEEERREWRARSGESNDVSRRTKSSSAPRRTDPLELRVAGSAMDLGSAIDVGSEAGDPPRAIDAGKTGDEFGSAIEDGRGEGGPAGSAIDCGNIGFGGSSFWPL